MRAAVSDINAALDRCGRPNGPAISPARHALSNLDKAYPFQRRQCGGCTTGHRAGASLTAGSKPVDRL